jgi:hypothetical protein
MARKARKFASDWERGVFVPEDSISSPQRAAADAAAENTFLACLDKLTAQGRRPSSSKGQTYGPTMFVKSGLCNGMTRHALAEAMERVAAKNPDLKPSKAGMVILRPK